MKPYQYCPNAPSERNLKIAALRHSGLTLQRVGDLQEPKLTRERVRQIVWKTNYYARRAESEGENRDEAPMEAQ